jgi:tetratricopeptide (TPR) repeat protein
VLLVQNKLQEAQEEYAKAIALLQRLAHDFPQKTQYQIDLAGSYGILGTALEATGKAEDSLLWFNKAIAALTPIVRQQPQLAQARLYLRNSHRGRALAYGKLQKHAEAAQDWDRTVTLSPPQQQGFFRVRRADSRVRAGKPTEAVADVEELARMPGWPAAFWYDSARIYAIASGKDADNKQAYADRAMQLLHRAVQAGFKDADTIANDRDLDPLRDRDDFKKFLDGLKK